MSEVLLQLGWGRWRVRGRRPLGHLEQKEWVRKALGTGTGSGCSRDRKNVLCLSCERKELGVVGNGQVTQQLWKGVRWKVFLFQIFNCYFSVLKFPFNSFLHIFCFLCRYFLFSFIAGIFAFIAWNILKYLCQIISTSGPSWLWCLLIIFSHINWDFHMLGNSGLYTGCFECRVIRL